MKTNARFLIPLTLLTSQAVLAAAESDVVSKSQKEISIMSNILKASLDAEQGIRVRQIKGAYLAEQGYVFNISAKGISGSFGGWKQFFVQPDFDVEFDEAEMMIKAEEMRIEAANQSYQVAMETLRESSDKMREFAEQEREIEFQIREVERERRDLNLERRHAQKEKDEKSVEKEIAKLEAKIAKLEKEKAQVRDKRDDAKDKIKSTTKEKQQKLAEVRKQNIRVVSNTLAQTLCDYGAGLKGLNKNQYVNFIIDNATGNKEDLVFVFNKAQINKCVVGDMDAKKLLASAQSYTF
ncbi:hypothetical protein AAEU29_16430 [Pseudoalteromonas sp. SSM20]|uniref:hypothetical protein n=1 Tax=Pseudoalteromonas sp. SSM20 TaxID=3139394 RepID=UPI003BA9B007